jgi:hypothetical protein
MGSENILVWNVCGLNAAAHHNALRSLVASERPSVVYLQETKLTVIQDSDMLQLIGRLLFLAVLWGHLGGLVDFSLVVPECFLPPILGFD